MLVTSMFYTRSEHTQRVGYWCEYWTIVEFEVIYCFLTTLFWSDMAGMCGSSFLGFLAFGLLHITVRDSTFTT